jgi:hypothetical protein
MYLTNPKGGHFNVTHKGWEELLATAKAQGWTPAGTVPPGDGYYCNGGQEVTADDAAALAAALERSLNPDWEQLVGAFLDFVKKGQGGFIIR